MSDKARLLMLVGLPASGKSSLAREMLEGREDIIYLSSDKIREELYGDESIQKDHSQVFVLMAQRTKEALKSGKHVIYDATNVSRKKRKGLLQQLPRNIEKTVVYMATDYNDVLAQNELRERNVPKHSIDRMYKTMQIPIYSEGWDNITILHHDNTLNTELPKQVSDAIRAGVLLGREGYELMQFLATYFNPFSDVYELSQDSKYHNFSVSRHIYYVYKEVLDNYETEDETEREMMLWTALLHDVGKKFSKSFYNRKGEETRYANFIGHENVSSQMAVIILKQLGFGDEFIHTVATLIQFHMYLLDSNANRDKLLGYVGEDLYKKLEFLRDADTKAH